MNRDIQTQKGSDYVLRLELLGANNTAYAFADEDQLHIHFSDIKGSIVESVGIDLIDFANPLVYVITAELLEQFTSDPVKYKIVLTKADFIITLLSGNIYRES